MDEAERAAASRGARQEHEARDLPGDAVRRGGMLRVGSPCSGHCGLGTAKRGQASVKSVPRCHETLTGVETAGMAWSSEARGAAVRPRCICHCPRCWPLFLRDRFPRSHRHWALSLLSSFMFSFACALVGAY